MGSRLHSNVLCATYHVLGRLRRISANYSGALDVGRADKARRQIDKKNVRQAAVYVLEERAADRDRHGLITESTKRSTSSTSPSRSSSRTTSQPPPCRMIARSPPPQCKTCSGGTGPTPSTPSCSCPEAPAACGERRRGRRHAGRAIARRHRRRTPCAAASRRRRCRRRESPTASGSPSASLTRSPSEQAACRWGTACSPAATTSARQAARCRRWNSWRRHRRSADRARRVRRRRRRHVQGGRRHAVNEARQHRRQ